MSPIILFENYGFQYRAQSSPTLYDINLVVNPGEKLLIVGPSGSGKSTIASSINGLIPFNYAGQATGRLLIAGEESAIKNIFELSKTVGTVLQDPDAQFVGLTAGEDIAFSLENDNVNVGEMRERVSSAAALVGIDTQLDSSPYDLSGGQKQRVSMAGVIINKVKVLLFDEPLANLDPATGKQAIYQVDDIMKKTDATVLIIEHRLEDALEREVDRIILVNDGRILADMEPDELLCLELLKENGIREPLYLTALKYANVQITRDKCPSHISKLKLSESEKNAVKSWYTSTNPPQLVKRDKELLRVENMSFYYEQGKPVLENISFTVNEGEMTAIVGTNGAGKSTLAKLICGFEKPKSGSIYMNGRDMANDTISERADSIGYVMQNPNQMISKTMIFDEVALGLISRGVPMDKVVRRVEETLKVCGLYQFRNWPISALSFGQKKRVTIASVLVMEPKIIILDEPTAGQDFRHYTDIMEFLRNLNRQGVTVLMITHDMHLMLEYAPRALVFSAGKLIADTTAAAALTDEAITKAASLKQTSLYELAKLCGLLGEAEAFVQHFIDYDREVRNHG